MCSEVDFLVCIDCITFNQSFYVTDTMNGFVIQQTDFPYVAVIIDDDSTDGEQDVIRNYIDEHFDHSQESGFRKWETEDAYWTFAQHMENKNCHFVAVYLKKILYKNPNKKAELVKDWMSAKYIAICEGDDYWTDSLKLQKQVRFLDGHSEFDMVCGRFMRLFETNHDLVDSDLYDGIMPKDSNGMELLHEHYLYSALPQPCTVLYRAGTLSDNPVISKLRFKFDIPLYWCFMDKHRVWLMNEKVSVYRKHGSSLTSMGISEQWDIYLSYVELTQFYPNNEILRKLCAASYRTWRVIPAAYDDNYGLRSFVHDMKVYLGYKPSVYNVLTLAMRVIEVKLKKLKN